MRISPSGIALNFSSPQDKAVKSYQALSNSETPIMFLRIVSFCIHGDRGQYAAFENEAVIVPPVTILWLIMLCINVDFRTPQAQWSWWFPYGQWDSGSGMWALFLKAMIILHSWTRLMECRTILKFRMVVSCLPVEYPRTLGSMVWVIL